jgi:plasmid stability protein
MHASHALHARFRYDCFITVITIRNFDSLIKRSPQVRAAMNGRSMEAEVRAILTAIVSYVPIAEMPGPEPAAPEKE